MVRGARALRVSHRDPGPGTRVPDVGAPLWRDGGGSGSRHTGAPTGAVRLLLPLVLAMGLSACASNGVEVELRGHTFAVEVADDDQERARGLMHRDALPADSGMLFLFDREEPQAFWMKNTRIPLDILYFDRNWTLVGWSLNTPPCSLGDQCPNYPSQAPARYVLELNAGTSERIGASFGDKLTVRGLPGH